MTFTDKAERAANKSRSPLSTLCKEKLEPLKGSNAIDVGFNLLYSNDQRGLDLLFNGTSDIGAVEVQTEK